MSQRELADAVNTWLYQNTARVFTMDAGHIGRYERGKYRRPHPHYRRALCAVLAATDEELGFWTTSRTARTTEHPPAGQVVIGQIPLGEHHSIRQPPDPANTSPQTGDDDCASTDPHTMIIRSVHVTPSPSGLRITCTVDIPLPAYPHSPGTPPDSVDQDRGPEPPPETTMRHDPGTRLRSAAP